MNSDYIHNDCIKLWAVAICYVNVLPYIKTEHKMDKRTKRWHAHGL